MTETILLQNTLESQPANNAAASNVGADNIHIKEEVWLAAQKAATGRFGANMGNSLQLDGNKLTAKVCAIVKSKRGLSEKQLPKELFEAICDEVNKLRSSVFTERMTTGANLTFKRAPMFRKLSETAPVAVKTTMTSIHEIDFKEQRLLLNVKLADEREKLKRADACSNVDRAAKWQKAINATEAMLATLTDAELIASEAVK